MLTKQRTISPFILNEAQIALYRRYRQALIDGRPFRACVPKFRQGGVSTLCSALAFEQFCNRPGTTVSVLAHKEPAAKNLFSIPKRFFRLMKDAPALEASSRLEMIAAPPVESRYLVMTAGSGDDLGKAFTVNFLHWSEAASCTVDPDDAFTSISNAVPDEPGTSVSRESTAKGRDLFFYGLCQEALAGKNLFEVIFLPWYLHENEYSMTWDRYAKMHHARGLEVADEFEPTEEELTIRNRIKTLTVGANDDYLRREITDEQFVWRRFTIANKCKSKTEVFHRYFPTVIDDCWTFTEHGFFSDDTTKHYFDMARDPKRKGDMKAIGKKVRLEDSGAGHTFCWEEPVSGKEYVLSADVSEGIPGGDWQVAYVIREDTLEAVAMIRGRMDPDEYGIQLYRLGEWYNWALVCVENNYPEVARRLYYTHSYPNVWFDRNIASSQKSVSKPGWNMNANTRKIVLGVLETDVGGRKARVYEQGFSVEMSDLIFNETRRKYQAAGGRHDDRLVALGIGLAVIDFRGNRRRNQPDARPLSTMEESIVAVKRAMKEEDKAAKRERFNWRLRKGRRPGGMTFG